MRKDVVEIAKNTYRQLQIIIILTWPEGMGWIASVKYVIEI